MPSSKALDRPVSAWFQKLENGEIKLPRFQRHQAWDKKRICSLLNTVIQNLPLGVTLILDVDKEQFVSRYVVSAPETNGRVTEHLLDGQQRITALWRALHNNYEDDKYFLYFGQYDLENEEPSSEVSVNVVGRWSNKNGNRMPLWADSAESSFKRGLIPLEFFRPGDISKEYESWVNEAMVSRKPSPGSENYEEQLFQWMESKTTLLGEIRDIRETITHFNLPFLSLPASTDKETALQVFINMNTNSKPLSQYDIIRAEIERESRKSLDELEKHLNESYTNVKYYEEISYLILATSALLQDKIPNQRGMWDMDKKTMVANWDLMESCLDHMASFLSSQGVYDRQRLPTNAVLAVVAALFRFLPKNVDLQGQFYVLLKKYLWSSFFTDRYENSAASNAYADFIGLKRILTKTTKDSGELYQEMDVPVLNREKHSISDFDQLVKVGWPKRENIRARGVMAVFYNLGALDFAKGTSITREQLLNGQRHYHHVFPDSIIKHLEVEPFLALNCALISDDTNLNISNKEPLKYLKERYDLMDESVVNNRLWSHLIPINELANGGYDNLSETEKDEKLLVDYKSFIHKRAQYVLSAIARLTEGKDIVASEIIKEVEQNEMTHA